MSIIKGSKELVPVNPGRAGKTGEAGKAESCRKEADRISIASGQNMERLASESINLQGNRAAKLAEIRAAVRQGEFMVDVDRLARKIINDAEISARIRVLLSKI